MYQPFFLFKLQKLPMYQSKNLEKKMCKKLLACFRLMHSQKISFYILKIPYAVEHKISKTFRQKSKMIALHLCLLSLKKFTSTAKTGRCCDHMKTSKKPVLIKLFW